jgi:hypothetical protein
MSKTLIALIGLILTSTAAMAEPCIVNDQSGTPLNVRKVPDGQIIGALSNGLLVSTGERRGDWVWVTPHEGPGKSGWVYRKHLNCAQSEKKAHVIGDSVDVHPWTADQYMKHCISDIEERYFACQLYTRGFADGVIVRSYFSKDEQSICIPRGKDSVTTKQLIDVAIGYIRKRPEQKGTWSAILMTFAFREAWPCSAEEKKL